MSPRIDKFIVILTIGLAFIAWWMLDGICYATDLEAEEHKLLLARIIYIEDHLGIPDGRKEKIDNNTVWFDIDRRIILTTDKGRLNRLAGLLGYKWFREGDDDFADWHKVSDECIPKNNCLDTNLGL